MRTVADLIREAEARTEAQRMLPCPDCGTIVLNAASAIRPQQCKPCFQKALGVADCSICGLSWYVDVLTDGECGNCRFGRRFGHSTGSLGQDWFDERG